MSEKKTSEQLLSEICAIDGVAAALIIGMDGFVVESKGTGSLNNLDALGASVAKTFSGIAAIGNENNVGSFSNLYIEYENTMILGYPIDDMLVSVIAPDHGKLASIRFKLKAIMPEGLEFGS